tara:strand:+ start:2493 stop:3023 length:531 start_codon:yes stop_codon:yes gene_type:complete
MVDSILFYRDSTHKKDGVGSTYYDPTDLPTTGGINNGGFKLSFTTPTNILEVVDEVYTNNIIDIPVPISDGTRKINKQDNGLSSYIFTINGVFENNLNDLTMLNTLRKMQQVTTEHPFGCLGFYSPNAPQFSIDPNANGSTNATKGLTLKSTRIGFAGQKKKRYGFAVTLSFGGTL